MTQVPEPQHQIQAQNSVHDPLQSQVSLGNQRTDLRGVAARIQAPRILPPRPMVPLNHSVQLSLVAPVYNEEENLRPLYDRVVEIFQDEIAWELVLVDDGSTDGSAQGIETLAREDARVRGVFFERNCGQTAALSAGIRSAQGVLLATMDSDMQNDPVDLPAMLAQLGEHDAVVGYRLKRNDSWLRRVSSKVANGVRNRLSGDQIRDTGCSLKLFRTEAIRDVALFEGMHRFLPTLLRYKGYSVIEHPVTHHPRTRGVSKYGVWNRVFRSFRDLIAVRWMRSRMIRLPIKEQRGS